MNADPAQFPLDPPQGLTAVNPENLEAGKHYFLTLVEIENNAVVPNDRPWWDYGTLRTIDAAEFTFDRVKTFMTNAAGFDYWYTLDPVDDPDEMMDMTHPRDSVVETTNGRPDGQYFIFYTIPPPAPVQQEAGRRRIRRRRTIKRRFRTRLTRRRG
jgi:hypothetical protein